MNKKILSVLTVILLLAGNAAAMNKNGTRIKCVSLKSLFLEEIYSETDIRTIEEINNIIKQKKDNITAIDFRCYNSDMNNGEKILWENGKWNELKDLKEMRCDNSDVPPDVLNTLLTNNPNLTDISLVYVRSEPLLKDLNFKNIKKLKTLDISGHTLSDQVDEFNEIIRNNQNLRDLKISFCENFPWKKVAWKELKKLKKLSLVFIDIKKEDLEIILKIRPKLKLVTNKCENLCPKVQSSTASASK